MLTEIDHAYSVDGLSGVNSLLATTEFTQGLSVYGKAARYAYSGDRETALNYLETAFEGKHYVLPQANNSYPFQILHNEPRFIELMQKMGL